MWGNVCNLYIIPTLLLYTIPILDGCSLRTFRQRVICQQ